MTTEVNDLLSDALFEEIPWNIAVIDRDFNIVRANSNFRSYFGDWRGKRCYQVYKGRDEICSSCQSSLVFEDGKPRVSDETGVDSSGRACHYIVHLAPLKNANGEVEYILEMSRDVTETKLFQREYDILFDRVPCYISVIDRKFRIIRANEKFRETFGEVRGRTCYEACKQRSAPCSNCPAARSFQDGQEHISEMEGVSVSGEPVYYQVITRPLARGDGEFEHLIEISTDITELKQLEKQKLEAERLASVGQTVAGLAHTIKNMLMGLEGGMYMVDSGLKRNDAARISKGWGVLRRNFDKTTQLVRGFLSFAKGRLPELQPVDPNEIMRNIHQLYHDTAAQQGVELVLELEEDITEQPLDPAGMEACLTNLLSNGIDAAMLRDEEGGRVVLKTLDTNDELIFEVRDNGIGMDSEVKQKVFTTFFTTKGGKGTGLGLLTTRKIVQEHGGRIEMESEEGVGSTFRIRLPKARLQLIESELEKKHTDGGDTK